jgi:chromosome segregation ATPase
MINELKEKLAEAQAQLSASQKEIQVKSNRLDISRESLKEIEKKLLQLKSERQTALASGEKPDKIDRLIDTVKKDQVDLQDTISGCLTAVESAKDNMESAKEAVKTLQEEIATAELLATVDEYNAAAFQFSEMCEKIFRLSAA